MKIDLVTAGQGVNISNLPDILSKVNVGDVVRAQVIDLTSNEIFLKLFDGTTVSAAMSNNTSIDAKRGDFIDFTVKGKNDNQIILETLKLSDKPSVDDDASLKKLMLAIEMKPDEKNMEIAKEINRYNLPFKKEVFQNIIDTVSKFKEITPEKAAYLTANNIKIEEKNIESLNQLISGKAKVSAGLSDLTQALSEVKDDTLIKNIIKQLNDVNPSRFQSSDDEIDNTIKQTNPNNMIINVVNTDTEIKADIENVISYIKEKVPQPDVSKKINDTLNSLNVSIDNDFNSEAINTLNSKINAPLNNNGNVLKEFNKDLADILPKVVENKEIPVKVRSELGILIDKLITKIKTKNQMQDNRNLSREISAKDDDLGVRDVLKKTIQKLYVKPETENIKDEVNLKNLYKDISKTIDIIKDNIEKSNLINKSEIINRIDNLDNNLKFINELNNHNTYIQIPIALSNTNTTGELYILKKDSKKKKIDPSNVTMFISLDTENIGRVDSLISLDRKNVSVNMRVEDKRVFNIIKENYKNLYDALNEKGYKLVNLNYRIIEEDPNVINIDQIINKENERNRKSIDYKI